MKKRGILTALLCVALVLSLSLPGLQAALAEAAEETAEPTEIIETTPEETPLPSTEPEATPETTPEITPEPTPDTTPEATSNESPEETPEPTPEETPEPTPEQTLFDSLMACATLDELFTMLDEAPVEQLQALTEEEHAALQAKIAALEPEPLPPVMPQELSDAPVVSEIIHPTVNFAAVAPFRAPVTGDGE